jgi:hypothetical protein
MRHVLHGLFLIILLAGAASAEDTTFRGTWKGRGTKPSGDPIEFTVDGSGKISGTAELSFGHSTVGGELTVVDQASGKLKGRLTFDGTEFAVVDMHVTSPGEHGRRMRIAGTTSLDFMLDVSGGGRVTAAQGATGGQHAEARPADDQPSAR